MWDAVRQPARRGEAYAPRHGDHARISRALVLDTRVEGVGRKHLKYSSEWACVNHRVRL